MKLADTILKSLDVLLLEDNDNNHVVIKSGYNRVPRMILLILGFLPFVIILYSLFSFVKSNGIDVGVIFFGTLGILGLLLYLNFIFSVLFNSIELKKNEIISKVYSKFKFSTQINNITDLSEFKTNYSKEMKIYLKILIVSKETREVSVFGSKPPYIEDHVIALEQYLQELVTIVPVDERKMSILSTDKEEE
ncbi:MAG: hypothetical protein ACJAXV_000340 [Bacteroidia bacterium]|jgi:hypothetical protein